MSASTIDANILIYASNESDPAHQPARRLVERLARGPDLVYVFWPVVMAYLRIVTHPAILPRPLSAMAALANVDALLARPHLLTPCEGDGFWGLFQQVAGLDTAGNAVPDAHLVSLMRRHGVGRIFSRDRDLRRYEGVVVVDPFA